MKFNGKIKTLIFIIVIWSVYVVKAGATDVESFIVGISYGRTPYEEYEDNEAHGIMIDYLSLISDMTGLSFDYVYFKNRDDLVKSIDSGEIQIAFSVMDNWSTNVNMSEKCFSDRMCIVTDYKTAKTYGEDISDIFNNKMICAILEKNYVCDEITNGNKELNYRTYDSYRACMDAVKRKETGYAIIPEIAATKLKEHAFYEDLSVIPYYDFEVCICVSGSCPLNVLESINSGIEQIDELSKERILVENLYIDKDDVELRDLIAENKMIVSIITAALIVIMIFILIYKFSRADINQMENITDYLMMYNKFSDSKNVVETNKLFLAKLGHDIKNPMNAIMGLTECAMERIDDPVAISNYLKDIKSSGAYLVNLTDNIMDITKSKDGKLVLKKETVSLYEAIDEIDVIISRQAIEKKLKYKINCDDLSEDMVITDKARFQQILINLLVNAVKYTKEGGTVNLYVSSKKHANKKIYVSVVISDSGIGISEEFKLRLFEPFERENRYGRDSYGYGLGMTIVKELVNYMNGDIKVKSKIGKGTRVSLDFIFDEPKHKNKINKNLKGINILAADDSPINVQLIGEFLSSYGVKTDIAEGGEQCLKMYLKSPENHYKLIIIDINMPDITGNMVAKCIRESERTDAKDIKIIGLTAEEQEEVELKYMDGCILKPINMKKLVMYLEGFVK